MPVNEDEKHALYVNMASIVFGAVRYVFSCKLESPKKHCQGPGGKHSTTRRYTYNLFCSVLLRLNEML